MAAVFLLPFLVFYVALKGLGILNGQGKWQCMGCIFTAVVGWNIAYACEVYLDWYRNFGSGRKEGRKKPRSEPGSPSHRLRPSPTRKKRFGESARNCALRSRPSIIGLLEELDEKEPPRLSLRGLRAPSDEYRDRDIQERERAGIVNPVKSFDFNEDKSKEPQSNIKNTTNSQKDAKGTIECPARNNKQWHSSARIKPLDVSLRAQALSMDHVFVTFPEYLWAYYFIYPCIALNLALKLGKTIFYKWMIFDLGWWGGAKSAEKDEPNWKSISAELLLQSTSLVLGFTAVRKDKNGREIATFCYPDVPIINADGSGVSIVGIFTLDVDLERRELVKSRLGEEPLSARKTQMMLLYYIANFSHVTIHAYANWGTNLHVKNADPFERLTSLCTIMYNYFGFHGFKSVSMQLHRIGWLRTPALSENVQKVFQLSMDRGIRSHRDLRQLMKYSRVVNFVVKLRAYFLLEFEKHEGFQDVDGEALFIGTVLHSIDHSVVEEITAGSEHYNVSLMSDPEYGVCAEVAHIVYQSFNSDLPFIMFTRKFKDATHPFYSKIYRKAETLDKHLADMMDCAIIK